MLRKSITLKFWLILILSLALVACGGDDDDNDTALNDTPEEVIDDGNDVVDDTPVENDDGSNPPPAMTTTLSGTAAVGAPLIGTVQAINAAGIVSNQVMTDGNGFFTVEVDSGSPYMLRAQSSDGVTVLYSFATQEGTVNITPLTHLAVYLAGGHPTDLAQLYAEWGQQTLSAEEVEAAAAVVAANLAGQFEAQGLDWDAYDFFNTFFIPDQTGFDAVLDGIQVRIDRTADSVNEAVTVLGPDGTPLIEFNISIDPDKVVVEPPSEGDDNSGQVPADSVWLLTATATVGGVSQTLPNQQIPGSEVPKTQDALVSTSEQAITGEVDIQGLTVTLSGVDVFYESSIRGQVGDLITGRVTGTYSASGTVQGQPVNLPPTTFTTEYRYERIQ